MKILDLRQETEVSADYSRKTSEVNWISAWAVALVMLVGLISFNIWLDKGCALQGVMTWHGKECIN